MRLLFELDQHDYDACTHTLVRDSARSIILADQKLAMVHSMKYDFYKFPGGGIEGGEDPIAAMIRETREEAGLVVKPETVKEYGYVHRVEKSPEDESQCFVQDNYYYLCQAEAETVAQCLDPYESEEHYVLEFVAPQIVLAKNRQANSGPYSPVMLEREARVIELLIAEGLLD
jgi:8-oxo-dGTP pyrophosphatase MutT (NUDIX family)